jgi:hypothetical protein
MSEIVMEELSIEDKKKVNACNGYRSSKRIMKSFADYSEYEVGTAVFIKENLKNGTTCYVGADYNNIHPRDKYIIIHKDEGFIFAKRIIACGKPGTLVVCLTIDYPSDRYELEVDGDYLDAMLLDTVDSYDPTATAKDLIKKKNKASRTNNKNRIIFDTALAAYNYIANLKIGDELWGADYSYGTGTRKYVVSNIKIYDLDKTQQARTGYGCSHKHGSYLKEKLPKGIEVTLQVIENENRYGSSSDRNIHFYSIMSTGDDYKYSAEILYNKRPLKPEDVI